MIPGVPYLAVTFSWIRIAPAVRVAAQPREGFSRHQQLTAPPSTAVSLPLLTSTITPLLYKELRVVSTYSPLLLCYSRCRPDLDLIRRFTSSFERVHCLELGRLDFHDREGLSRQLARSKDFLAGDPKDRVFALLGVVKFDQSQHTILPDYSRSKSVQYVFAEATISALQENVEILYGELPLHPLPGYNSQTLPDLPSWTLDLRIYTQIPIVRGDNLSEEIRQHGPGTEQSLLRGIQHIPFRVTASRDFTRLHTVGIHLGTICDIISSTGDQSTKEQSEIIRTMYVSCMRPRGIPASKLWNAMTCNGKFDRNAQEHEQMFTLFESFLGSTMDGNCINPTLFLHPHVLFLTDKDDVGLTYHPDPQNGVRPDDELIGLFGINYSMILRAVEGGLDGAPAHTMINVCHVADHELGHDFLKDTKPDARWEDFEKDGLKRYTII